MAGVTISPLCPWHARSVVRGINGCLRGAHYAFPFTSRMLRQRLAFPAWDKLALVGAEDGRVVAFAQANRFAGGTALRQGSDERSAYLSLLWVSPTHRMMGVGRSLVERIVEWAGSQKASRLAVDFHSLAFWPGVDGGWADAQVFLDRMGFRPLRSYASAFCDLTTRSTPDPIRRRAEELRREGMAFRPFSPADRDPLLHFALSTFGFDAHEEIRARIERVRHGFNRHGMDWTKLREPDGVLLAARPGRIEGYVVLSSRLRRNLAAIGFVGVHPERRSRGIGGVLLANALDSLRARGVSGADTWMEHDSRLLRHCCSSLGFRVCRKWHAYELPVA